MNNTNDFEFKYTAPTTKERREIESIRASYLQEPKSSSKLTRLRKLDAKVRALPSAIAITIGIIGLLIFGLGFTMILEWEIVPWGIIVSALGITLISFAYPMHTSLSKKIRRKYSKEIIELSDELLNENE